MSIIKKVSYSNLSEEIKADILLKKQNDFRETFLNSYITRINILNPLIDKFNDEVKDLIHLNDVQKQSHKILSSNFNELDKEYISIEAENKYLPYKEISIHKPHELVPYFELPDENSSDNAYVTSDGRFYPTVFQGHTSLEEKMKDYFKYNYSLIGRSWAERRWIRISDGEINWMRDIEYSENQIHTVFIFALAKTGDEKETIRTYEGEMTPEEILYKLEKLVKK